MRAPVILNHTVHAESVACTDGTHHTVHAFHTVHAPAGHAFVIPGDLAQRTMLVGSGASTVANVFGTPDAAAAHARRLGTGGGSAGSSGQVGCDPAKYTAILHILLFALAASAISWLGSSVLASLLLPKILKDDP